MVFSCRNSLVFAKQITSTCKQIASSHRNLSTQTKHVGLLTFILPGILVCEHRSDRTEVIFETKVNGILRVLIINSRSGRCFFYLLGFKNQTSSNGISFIFCTKAVVMVIFRPLSNGIIASCLIGIHCRNCQAAEIRRNIGNCVIYTAEACSDFRSPRAKAIACSECPTSKNLIRTGSR